MTIKVPIVHLTHQKAANLSNWNAAASDRNTEVHSSVATAPNKAAAIVLIAGTD